MYWLKPPPEPTPDSSPNGKVRLKAQYLILDREIVAAALGEAQQIQLVFYANTRTLLLAAKEDPVFPTIHKAKIMLLKDRTAQGDKSVSLHEILIDHELDDSDRDLPYRWDETTPFLTINL